MNTQKPKRLSSRSVYKNQYVEFLVDTLEKDGRQWEQAYFIKPNNDGVGIIPIEDDSVYLLSQYRYAIDKFLWQIPLGQVEISQAPDEAARNELQEEVGFTADTIEKIGSMYGEPGMSSQMVHVYTAQGLHAVESSTHYNEVIDKIKKFSFAEIDEMIAKGEITCGFTLSALRILQSVSGD